MSSAMHGREAAGSPGPLQGLTRRAGYRGRDLLCPFTSSGVVVLEDDGQDFPDEVDRGTAPVGRPWVAVPPSAVEFTYRRSANALWRGERVQIDAVDEAAGVASFWFTGDQDWARAQGLKGSPMEGGFFGTAPVTELDDVRVVDGDRSPGR